MLLCSTLTVKNIIVTLKTLNDGYQFSCYFLFVTHRTQMFFQADLAPFVDTGQLASSAVVSADANEMARVNEGCGGQLHIPSLARTVEKKVWQGKV